MGEASAARDRYRNRNRMRTPLEAIDHDKETDTDKDGESFRGMQADGVPEKRTAAEIGRRVQLGDPRGFCRVQLGDPRGFAEYNSAIPGVLPSATRRSQGGILFGRYMDDFFVP
jgi:hypothetical protein